MQFIITNILSWRCFLNIASALNIRQIDIIDKSYDYNKWTNHFRNYNSVYRKNFKHLSNEILKIV